MKQWRLVPGQALRLRCWDDECVLYNDLSGDTHLLSRAGVAALQGLEGGYAAVPALAAHMSAALGLDAEPLDAGEVTALLDELARLALVEPLP